MDAKRETSEGRMIWSRNILERIEWWSVEEERSSL